jgi:hypothetical protein
MISNLKALGLALVAMLALGALTASAASAQGKITSDGSVTLHGKHLAGVNALTAFGGRTECPNATYTGHKVGSTTELIANGSTQATITPHYGLCKTIAGFEFSSTVDMNGCDYVFDLEGTTGGVAHTYGVKATVVCPKNAHIQVTLFTSSSHTDSNRFCTTTITENAAGYLGLHATDLTNGKLQISGTIEGIAAHKVTGPDNNSFLCATASTETAKLDLDIEVEGKNSSGGATNVSLSD